jgi:hypothetical protein
MKQLGTLSEDKSGGKYSVWDQPFRHFSESTKVEGYSRGVLRSTMHRDPYVNEALKCFSGDIHSKVKMFSRFAGSESDLVAALRGYDKPEHRITNSKLKASLQHAFNKVKKQLNFGFKVVPTFVNDVDMVMNTSSGYPIFERKAKHEKRIRAEARKLFHHMKRLDRGRIGYPYVAPAAKGGLTDQTDPKTRFVWMYPAAMSNCEAVFAQPLISAFYKHKSEYFLSGASSVDNIHKFCTMLDECEEGYGVGLDFSKFDRLPVNQLIRMAFEIIDQNIDHGRYYDRKNGIESGGVGVERRSRKAFENIVDYFINTPLILPNGRVVTKHIGVPSGSNFTNIVDSIINMLLHETFAHHENVKILHLKVNGDDSAFITRAPYARYVLVMAAKFFKDAFRMTINTDKSCVAVLPSVMHISGTKWKRLKRTRTTEEWFAMALCPRAYVRNTFESFQRLLGIGLAGAFHDHKYCDFFDYFQTGYDCRKDSPNLLDWTKYRWLQYAYGITDLPKVYKSKPNTFKRIGLLMYNC